VGKQGRRGEKRREEKRRGEKRTAGGYLRYFCGGADYLLPKYY
jgi:hypothetical protein